MISSFFSSNNSNKKLNDIDEHNKLGVAENVLIYNDVYIINNQANQLLNENDIHFNNCEKLRLKLTNTHLILQTKNLKFLINNSDDNNANDATITEYQQFAFSNSILKSENDEKVKIYIENSANLNNIIRFIFILSHELSS
jgi:hypothetical protein